MVLRPLATTNDTFLTHTTHTHKGGIAGLSCANLLLDDPRIRGIDLIEKEKGVGGLCYSPYMPSNKDNSNRERVNLGPSEHHTSHKLLCKLLKQFQIEQSRHTNTDRLPEVCTSEAENMKIQIQNAKRKGLVCHRIMDILDEEPQFNADAVPWFHEVRAQHRRRASAQDSLSRHSRTFQTTAATQARTHRHRVERRALTLNSRASGFLSATRINTHTQMALAQFGHTASSAKNFDNDS